MTTIITRKPHRTMHLVEKLMSRSKTRKFIHPAYRQVVLRKQRLCRRAKRKISVVRKILDRAIHYSPIPYVQPFLCQQCGLASSDMETLLEHNCGKKIGGLAEYSNWQRIVAHGYRSKAKDALAILETIPYPQKAKIKRIITKKHEEAVDGPVEPVFNPKSLVDCAYAVLEKTQFSQPADVLTISKPHKISSRNMLIKDDTYNESNRVGYYCHGCKKIFQPYYAFDEHLTDDSECTKSFKELEIVDITSHFPLNGNVIEPKISILKKEIMICTRCKRSDFETRELFHEHLFECDRNPDFDTDEDPAHTDTLGEESECST